MPNWIEQLKSILASAEAEAEQPAPVATQPPAPQAAVAAAQPSQPAPSEQPAAAPAMQTAAPVVTVPAAAPEVTTPPAVDADRVTELERKVESLAQRPTGATAVAEAPAPPMPKRGDEAALEARIAYEIKGVDGNPLNINYINPDRWVRS